MATRRTAEEHADASLARVRSALAAIEVELEDLRAQYAALDADEDEIRSTARWAKLGTQLALVVAKVAAARAGL